MMICHCVHSFYSLAGGEAARSDGAQLMMVAVQRLDSRWRRSRSERVSAGRSGTKSLIYAISSPSGQIESARLLDLILSGSAALLDGVDRFGRGVFRFWIRGEFRDVVGTKWLCWFVSGG
jgi:hypothetical protein